MDSKWPHKAFYSFPRRSQSLRNDRCQNILYKAVFEHLNELKWIAALLLTSKSFQNSSFGANFLVNWVVDHHSIDLLESVLSPSSCFSLQFAPSLHIEQSARSSEKVKRSCTHFVGELVSTKYFRLSLRSLTLYHAHVEVVAFFGSLSNSWPHLQDLTLENAALKDSDLEIISKNALQLRALNFSQSRGITNVSLEHISKLSGITCLNVSYCKWVTDDGLGKHICKLANITSLDLACCNKIMDDGLEYLSPLSGITDLNLSECNNITDDGLGHVSKLSRITTLSGCPQIGDEGIRRVTRLSNITRLDLSCCFHITDAGMEHLSKLSNIIFLDLADCEKITDAGLEHLSKLSDITSLDLTGCENITVEATKKLSVALPNCKLSAYYF